MQIQKDRFSPTTYAAVMAGTRRTVDAAVAGAMEDLDAGITFKGSVNYVSSLPESAETGDEYLVLYSGDSGTNYLGQKYVWDGSNWRSLGSDLKLYRDADGDLCEED